VTLKVDASGSPISEDALDMLILTKEEYKVLKNLTQQIGNVVRRSTKKDIELYGI
jgi:phosphoribosylaminoimidazole-succinocarboxamide synthase